MQLTGHGAFCEYRHCIAAGQPHKRKEHQNRDDEPEIGVVVKRVLFPHKRSEKVAKDLDKVHDPEADGVDCEFHQGDKQDVGLDAPGQLIFRVEYFIVHLGLFAPLI